jgi:hypothetical protein
VHTNRVLDVRCSHVNMHAHMLLHLCDRLVQLLFELQQLEEEGVELHHEFDETKDQLEDDIDTEIHR